MSLTSIVAVQTEAIATLCDMIIGRDSTKGTKTFLTGFAFLSALGAREPIATRAACRRF